MMADGRKEINAANILPRSKVDAGKRVLPVNKLGDSSTTTITLISKMGNRRE